MGLAYDGYCGDKRTSMGILKFQTTNLLECQKASETQKLLYHIVLEEKGQCPIIWDINRGRSQQVVPHRYARQLLPVLPHPVIPA